MDPAINLNADDIFLRMPDVERQTGLKKSTIYALIKKGQFPAPISLGSRASGWLMSSIDKWKQERIIASQENHS